jgi:hypothetical protein
MSIDFLAGIAIFLIAFLFMLSFIPGILTPFQSSSDELTMTADRMSIELVENLLVTNGSNPNVVNQTLVASYMNDLNSGSYDTVRNNLGLNGNRLYNINVTYSTIKKYTLTGGPAYPVGALNVGQSKRVVINETGDLGILYVTVW